MSMVVGTIRQATRPDWAFRKRTKRTNASTERRRVTTRGVSDPVDSGTGFSIVSCEFFPPEIMLGLERCRQSLPLHKR